MTDKAHQWVREAGEAMPGKPEPRTFNELCDLFIRHEDTGEALKAGIDATAAKTGFSKTAIRKALRATVKDRIGEAVAEIRQVAQLLNAEDV